MAIEQTFSILKPDVTRRNLTGAVNAMIEKAGLRIVAQRRVHMTRAQAETFYAVHKARPFFGELVETMIAGPVVVQVLQGEKRHQGLSRCAWSHRPGRSRAWHDPQGACDLRGRELRARIRRGRDRSARDCAMVRR